MSSFFTTPAPQRKRKRPDANSTVPRKRNPPASQSRAPARTEREDSITESESSDGERANVFDDDEDESET